MKEVYLLRHAEKDNAGIITEQGQQASYALRQNLPKFDGVYSSTSERAKLTAKFLTGREPTVDDRAGFYMANQDKSDTINELARRRQISFLDAVSEYADEEVLNGVTKKASELNAMVNELLAGLPQDGKSLIVSHDLSISPAMKQRDIPLASIDFLSGYVIRDDNSVTRYAP